MGRILQYGKRENCSKTTPLHFEKGSSLFFRVAMNCLSLELIFTDSLHQVVKQWLHRSLSSFMSRTMTFGVLP